MNIGRERITGRIVTAAAAAKTPNRQFACPICAGSLIYHAMSDYRVAFFGHRPHQAEPDCPLYFAPHDTDVERVVNERAYRVREPVLRLQLLNRQTNGYRWQACILIPRFERATSFSVENSTIYSRVPVSAIKEGGNPFPVTVQQASYVITTFEPDEPPERIMVDGFASVTLFRLSSHLCSRLEARAPLIAGEAYVVIHPAAANLAPPYGLVTAQPLLSNDGWSGFAFVLPASPTKDVAKWVAAKLDRRITEQDFSASIVAPADAYRLDDGAWMVTVPTPAITMAFAFGADHTPPSALTVVHNTAGRIQFVSLAARREAYLQIPNPHSGLYQIKRADTGAILLTVAVAPPGREAKQAGIYFLFSVNGRIERECLWSTELAPRLHGVSVGLANLVEISIPPGVRIAFSIGEGTKQQRRTIDSGESLAQGEAAGATLVRAIERVLKSVRPIFELDAGDFGKLAFPVQKPARLDDSTRISPVLAARQAWITLATPALMRRNGARVGEPAARLRAHIRQLSLSSGGVRS